MIHSKSLSLNEKFNKLNELNLYQKQPKKVVRKNSANTNLLKNSTNLEGCQFLKVTGKFKNQLASSPPPSFKTVRAMTGVERI